MTAAQQKTVQAAADETAEFGRENQLELESSLIGFIREHGLDIYEPNIDAFRKRVQNFYLESDYAKSWPQGLLERINSL